MESKLLQNTKFSVFGELSKKELESWNLNPKNIQITGASIFDEITNYSAKKAEEENTITLITDGFYIYGLTTKEKYFSYIKKIIEQVTSIPNTKLIIKTHPEEKEHLENYKELLKENVELVSTPGKDILYNLMSKSKLAINFGSTAALEALILDKPIITITNIHNSPIVEFDLVIERLKNSGASINLKTEDDISTPIIQILESKPLQLTLERARKKFVKDSCYIIDGESSKRTTEFLKQIWEQQIL